MDVDAAGGVRWKSRRRLWLTACVLLLNGVLAASSATFVLASRDRATQQVRTNAANLADLVARNLTDFGVQLNANLQGVQDAVAQAGGTAALTGDRVAAIVQRFEPRLPPGSRLHLVDGQRQPPELPSAPGQADAALADPQQALRHHRGQTDDRMQVWPPVRAGANAPWTVPCSRALRAPDGQVEGVVVASVPIAVFERMISGIDVGPSGLVLLRDVHRGLIAFNSPVRGPQGQVGSRQITPQAAALLDTGADKGSYDAPMSPDGVPRTYAFHWSRPMDTVVGVGMAPRDYLATWRTEALSNGLVLLAFLVITSAGAWFISRTWDRLAHDIVQRRQREEALRHSEQRLAGLVAASPDWVFEFDAAFVYTFSSERVTELLGVAPQAVVGRTVFDLLPAAEADRVRPLLQRLADQRLPIDLPEVVHLDTAGGERVLELRASAMLDGQGRLSGYRGLARDVTEDRRLHATLAKSEARWRQLVDESPLAIQVVGRNGSVLSVNRAWERLWGVPLAAMARYNMLEDAQLDAAGVLPMLQRVLAGGEPETVVTVYDRGATPTVEGAEGRLVVKTRIYGGRDQDGAVHELVLIQEDVTKLTEAEEELRRHRDHLEELVAERTLTCEVQQHKLESILNGIPGVVGYWDRDLRNRFANGGYTEWLGLPLAEVLGRRMDEVLPPEHLARMQPLIRQALDGQAQRGTSQFARIGQPGTRYAEIHYVPDRQDGVVAGFFVLAFDITELVLARQAAEEANVAKSVFLANMSHEIRTPMNGLLGMAHVLRRSGATPQQLQYLDRIEASGRHLLSVINDILDLSKIEAGKFELHEAPFQLPDLVQQLSGIVEAKAPGKGLAFEVDMADAPAYLVGDATRLLQALLNYLDNAVKFTASGRIGLRCRVQDRTDTHCLLRFEVWDTGRGLTPEQLSRVFEAFEQADKSTTREFGGSGLGLTIAHRIAQMMGGEAGAHSEPGRGSTFWLTARLGLGTAPPPAPRRVDQTAEALLRQHHAGRRVLLAEDNPISQEVAESLLEDAGLEVVTASDGLRAVALAGEAAFALILMDMQMPGLDGIRACEAIRQLPAHRTTPIVALTANAFDDDRQRCLAAGMSDFVSKPIEPDTLFRTLLRWLG